MNHPRTWFFSYGSWYCADHNQRYRCVLGSLGNLLVCLAIATNSHLRRASSYLLFSLAIADLNVTLICEPLFMEFIIQRTFLYDCKASLSLAYFILTYLSCATSVLHMVAISLDRFVAVVFPLRHKNFMDLRTHAYSILLNSDFFSWFFLTFCGVSFRRLFIQRPRFSFWEPVPSAISLFSFSTFWSWYFCCVTRGKESNSAELETFLWNWIPAWRFVFLVRWL